MFRQPMRRLAAIAVLSLSLVGLTGCKGACRQLSEQLCDCNTNSVERELCVRRASNDEARVEPTAEDEATCEAKLETCDCAAIETDEGKTACGLAR
ncbi:hypothetical protein [Hyalangium gracile]|uniref:hypothetical protein n=1 Tax=Hyalangium gracile TaxID=394092 RepID=UPI001CCE7932|nr:hypothetical protein [Hyalangium gracile]